MSSCGYDAGRGMPSTALAALDTARAGKTCRSASIHSKEATQPCNCGEVPRRYKGLQLKILMHRIEAALVS